MKTSIAMLVLLVSAGVGAPAMATVSTRAGDQGQTQKVLVRYGDLNVNTAAGAEQLYHRISLAAHEVCTDVGLPSYLTLHHIYQQCRQTAVEQAVATVDRPKLTALYDRHFPDNPLVAAKSSGRSLRSVG
ncbi:MAG TPA: UrcA family protein [Gammaproteobacteria bacterium]|nr:UrcA family protein [Gammaproteobacteria bacterium]